MFKKRLKGLLAMLLAGSMTLTMLPITASATISDSNVSVYDGDDTKVVDYSVSETLNIPVKNAFLKQEKDSSGADRYISVSKDSESLLDEENEENYYFYLCYYDEEQQSFKISDSAKKYEKDVWDVINAWVTADPNLDTDNLFLCRKVTVNVCGNGANSEFSTTELLDYLIVNQGNNTTNQALLALFTAKPNSIWEVNPRYTKNPPFYIYQKDAATSISDFLLEYPHEKRLNLFEQSSIRVTALDPKTNGAMGWDSFSESKLLDDNGESRKISDHCNDLIAAVQPEEGKKYDTDGWQLWEAAASSSGDIYDISKVELDKKPDSIGVTELNKMQKSFAFVYFPQVQIAPSLEVTAPVAGETPSFEYTIKDTVGGYSVNGVEWACGNDLLSENDKFEAGKEYTVSVVLQPEEGLQFVETTKVKINGNDATTLNPNDGTLKVSYTFEATKATPYIETAPTATAITYGEALSASTLRDAVVWYSESDKKAVEGTFTWKEAATKPTVADSDKTKYDVVFTPTDAENYNTVETKITLTVNKAASAPGLPNNTMEVDYGKKKVSDVTLPEGWAWQDADKDTALTVGTAVAATAVYTGADKGNYKTESVEISITRLKCTHATTEVKGAKAATCTEKGYTGDTYCKVCGEKVETGQDIDALGHDFAAEFTVDKEATCTEAGSKSKHCSRCDAKSEVTEIPVDKTKHGKTEIKDAKDATCTEKGYTGDTYCKVCGEKVETGQDINALGHDMTKTVSAEVKATCTEAGKEAVIGCSRCDHTEGGETIDALGHDFAAEFTVDKEATCTEVGSKSKHCSRCDEVTEVTPIPKKEHTWDSGKVTKEPTETAEGVKTYTCSVCGETKTEAIPKKTATTQEPPKKGDVVKDDKTSVKVEVSDVKKKEVEYKEPANKKAKTVSIPATVKIDGVTYKVTKVDDNAFKNNKTVTKVTVGSNIKTIGKNAFSGATKLKTVKIGKNVTEIGANAFKGCSSLTSVTLPSKATKIGANAFSGCKKLKTIKITSTKLTSKTVSKNAFKGLTKATTIKVPKKKLSAYKKLFKQKGLSSKVKVKGY